MSGVIALLALGAALDEKDCALVECDVGGLTIPKAKQTNELANNKKGCPGSPSCSGHGRCHKAADETYSCKCDAGSFGRDCSHQKLDCASLTSCQDCQDPANTKYCGWCADGRYCVPKHVHKALGAGSKTPPNKRQCLAWYEDTCPASRRPPPPRAGNESTTYPSPDAEGAEDWGDERSVALAEALVEMIDGAGGRGTSGILASLLFFLMAACGARLAYNERRAVEHQRRFDEYMREELASKREAAKGARLGSFGGRQLGPGIADEPPAPPEASRDGSAGCFSANAAAAAGVHAPSLNGTQTLNDASLAHALGVSASGGGAAGDGAAGTLAQQEREAAAVRAAAEADLAERKARQRQRATEARQAAEAAERRAAEEAARRALQSRTQEALTAAAATPAVGGASEQEQEPTEPLPAAFGKEEAEFLKALDDL